MYEPYSLLFTKLWGLGTKICILNMLQQMAKHWKLWMYEDLTHKAYGKMYTISNVWPSTATCSIYQYSSHKINLKRPTWKGENSKLVYMSALLDKKLKREITFIIHEYKDCFYMRVQNQVRTLLSRILEYLCLKVESIFWRRKNEVTLSTYISYLIVKI